MAAESVSRFMFTRTVARIARIANVYAHENLCEGLCDMETPVSNDARRRFCAEVMECLDRIGVPEQH